MLKKIFINKIDDILRNQETENSSRPFWQIMGRFMGRNGIQKRDNTFAFTDYEKAEELNSNFASISTIDGVNTDTPTFENRCNVDFTQIIITEF